MGFQGFKFGIKVRFIVNRRMSFSRSEREPSMRDGSSILPLLPSLVDNSKSRKEEKERPLVYTGLSTVQTFCGDVGVEWIN